MITRVQIEHYKSIRKLDLDLGRMNVFIGENGCGKTNVLEAIALGCAAANDKLDHERLVARGIRVTAPALMRSAFADAVPEIGVVLRTPGAPDAQFRLHVSDVDGVPTWVSEQAGRAGTMPDFMLYAPESSALRRFSDDGQVLPLGARGEGLFDHLQRLASAAGAPAIAEINRQLGLLDWFESLEIPDRDAAGRSLRIRDRYLPESVVLDQRSANEGFLFLLFYFTLFASPQTPRLFAIDNADAALNPKMCQAMMGAMVAIARMHDKQAIITTHNPALLDGLDLKDDEQRLFVVSRDDDGGTMVRRVSPPRPLDGDPPVRMSEAFLRGYIGGLPKTF